MALRERRKVTKSQPAGAARETRSLKGYLPLALALAAVLFALIGAVGPGKQAQARYSWPPRGLPAAQPQTLWYAPLLLARHQAQSLRVTIPCGPAPALPGAAQPALVFGTAREAVSSNGLAVLRSHGQLRVQVGGSTLAIVAADATKKRACAYRLDLEGGRWSLVGGPANVSRGGDLGQMPTVVGLFSALDLRHGASPRVELTTVPREARATTYQQVFWVLAALAALTALALVCLPRARHSDRSARRRLLTRVGLPDLAVTLLLLVWWVIGPAFFDDGWVTARQRNYAAAGGFSSYYTSFGVNLPLDYWVEWVEHWLVQSSTSLLVLRIPALVCLVATWALCRWLFTRTVGAAANGPARWALACAFAVGALAWGMTFRPEPVLALLITGVFVCVVAFVERERATPLALAAVLVVLSLSAHPAGIVAFAPLLAAAPAIVRWARRNINAIASIGVAATALLVVLVTVGSDLQQRRADITSLRTYGDEIAGWRDELARYSFLSEPPYSTPLRRASVALILLAVLAFVLRRRRNGTEGLLGLPATALGFALVLLVATPTKWPWHFGALVGLAAVALAAETARLGLTARASRRWDVRPFLVLVGATAAAGWAWNPRSAWSDLDLRTLHWTLGFESRLTLSKVAGALPLLVLIVLGVVVLARRRRSHLNEVPWRAAAWTVAIVAIPLLAFTVAVLIDDTAKTSSWTLGRQNLDSLRGRLHCGLGDDTLVATRSSMRPLGSLGSTSLPAGASWLPPAPAKGIRRFVLAPPPSGSGTTRSSWFRVPTTSRLGFFLAGSPTASETLQLEWGRQEGGTIEQITADDVAGDAASDARPDLAYWRFNAAGDLPSPPSGADAVRFALHTTAIPGGPVGLTEPVTYENESVATAFHREAPALPVPNLLMYVPCVALPKVGAVAETPGSILAFRDSTWPVMTDTSPFDGVTALYPIVRLPLSDSVNPPDGVALYEVDRHIDGGVVAPPLQTGS